MAKLEELIIEYLHWQERKDEAEGKLDGLKEEIIALAKEKNVKKIKSGKTLLLIITQQETRFPQLGEPGRKELERIIKESGGLQEVMIFDIITLGNLYDQKKLSPQLMEKLQPYAKKVKSTQIRLKEVSP